MTVLEAQKEKRYFPDIMIIAVQDDLNYWHEDIAKYCAKIETVYLIDRSVHWYMCEMTPSYQAIPLYPVFELKAEYDNEAFRDSGEYDRLYDDIHEGFNSCVVPVYFHTYCTFHIVHEDKMTFEAKRAYIQNFNYGYYENWDQYKAEYIESCREYYVSNTVY